MIEYLTFSIGSYLIGPDPYALEIVQGWILRAFFIICGLTVSFALFGMNRIADALTFLILLLAVSFFALSVLTWFLN